jgi:hypothetical protein
MVLFKEQMGNKKEVWLFQVLLKDFSNIGNKTTNVC